MRRTKKKPRFALGAKRGRAKSRRERLDRHDQVAPACLLGFDAGGLEPKAESLGLQPGGEGFCASGAAFEGFG
jgi:hypothetical protein